MTRYIVIKESYGWVIKEFNGKAPTNKFFKIFINRDLAEDYINDQI